MGKAETFRDEPRPSPFKARLSDRGVTWARTLSMCALIARRSIATTLRWRPTKRARRNVNSMTSSSEHPAKNLALARSGKLAGAFHYREFI